MGMYDVCRCGDHLDRHGPPDEDGDRPCLKCNCGNYEQAAE